VAAVAALLGEGLHDQAAVVIGRARPRGIFSFGGSGYGVFDPDDVRADVAAALPPRSTRWLTPAERR
jgi:hypothetical protein